MKKVLSTFLGAMTLLAILIDPTKGLSFGKLEAIPTNPTIIAPDSFYYEIKPGESITDSVLIRNHGEESIKIRVYATDLTINNQQLPVLKPYDQERTEVGTWVVFGEEKEIVMDLNPKEEIPLNFSITVPVDIERKNYQGGIMVENLNISNEKEIDKKILIKTNTRIGIKTEIKVTDSPQVIQKITKKQPDTSWRQTYFYVSIALFVVALGVLTTGYIRNRRQKKAEPKHSTDHQGENKTDKHDKKK